MNHRASSLVNRSLDKPGAIPHVSRRRILIVRIAYFLGGMGWALSLVLAPVCIAQSGKSSDAAKMQYASGSLSHDLSGVWMPYPESDVPPSTGKNAIDQASRPPLTPWGQARLEASKSLLG